MTRQTAQDNLLVNLKLVSHIDYVIDLCIFSKLVTHFLSYGLQQVLGVTRDVLDKY